MVAIPFVICPQANKYCPQKRPLITFKRFEMLKLLNAEVIFIPANTEQIGTHQLLLVTEISETALDERRKYKFLINS